MDTTPRVRAEIKGLREAAQGHLDIVAGQKDHLDEVDVDLLREFVVRLGEELALISTLERLMQLAERGV